MMHNHQKYSNFYVFFVCSNKTDTLFLLLRDNDFFLRPRYTERRKPQLLQRSHTL